MRVIFTSVSSQAYVRLLKLLDETVNLICFSKRAQELRFASKGIVRQMSQSDRSSAQMQG